MHIVHGELRQAPYIKQGVGTDGQSTLFIVELSEVTKDRQTGDKSYANYSAALFAKSPAQINHYTNQLVEGNFIVVNCEKLRVDVQESKGKQYIKLQMENARLEGTKYIDNQQQAPQQNFQQAPPQQAPQQQFAPQAPQQGQPMGVSQAQPQNGFPPQGQFSQDPPF